MNECITLNSTWVKSDLIQDISSGNLLDHKTKLSYLDLVGACDNFPYAHVQPKEFYHRINTYFHFRLSGYPLTLGLIPQEFIDVANLSHLFTLNKFKDKWQLNEECTPRTLTLHAESNVRDRTAAIMELLITLKAQANLKHLSGWRNELYTIYDHQGHPLFQIERAGCALFGFVTYGAHITAYVIPYNNNEPDHSKLSDPTSWLIWVSQRSLTKQTYPGMLDNTAAGGISSGETPLECIAREANEEVSLDSDYVYKHAEFVGCVSYIRQNITYPTRKLDSFDLSTIEPECQYVFDIKLPPDLTLRPNDGEVNQIYLWDIPRVKNALLLGLFKPNSALILIDFFIRHNLLSPLTLGIQYPQIVSRIHRNLEFPMLYTSPVFHSSCSPHHN